MIGERCRLCLVGLVSEILDRHFSDNSLELLGTTSGFKLYLKADDRVKNIVH